MKNKTIKCPTCGMDAHNFEIEVKQDCVPPKKTLKFGNYEINKNYRYALYRKHPDFTTEEIVGTFLGHNPNYPSQEEYFNKE